jgi:hypothetical protein
MDTRFWGPSGWQLCHLVAHSYTGKHTALYRSFFEVLKDVLPCRFCRESTTKFVEENPPDMQNIKKWLYDLHNRVNNKLRSQCKEDTKVICPPPDPHFEAVSKIYTSLLDQKPTSPPGMDFLFCVAYNYKSNPAAKAYDTLFHALSVIYPFEELRKFIPAHPDLSDMFAWWYRISKKMCSVTGCEFGSLRGTLQKYGRYKSGCKRGKTCRNGKKIRDHRHTYKVTHDRLLRIV